MVRKQEGTRLSEDRLGLALAETKAMLKASKGKK